MSTTRREKLFPPAATLLRPFLGRVCMQRFDKGSRCKQSLRHFKKRMMMCWGVQYFMDHQSKAFLQKFRRKQKPYHLPTYGGGMWIDIQLSPTFPLIWKIDFLQSQRKHEARFSPHLVFLPQEFTANFWQKAFVLEWTNRRRRTKNMEKKVEWKKRGFPYLPVAGKSPY